MPLQTPYDQLRETARSLGIDPSKYGPNDGAKLQADVIQVRAGGVIPKDKGIDIPDQPALAGPPAQQPPPPQPEQPQPANNPQGRAMQQAQAVVYGNPFTQDPYGNLASQRRSLDRTEAYIAKENDSRVRQARDEAERQHERELEMIKQKGLIDRLGSMQSQGSPPSSGGPLRVFDGKTTRYGRRVKIGRGGTEVY